MGLDDQIILMRSRILKLQAILEERLANIGGENLEHMFQFAQQSLSELGTMTENLKVLESQHDEASSLVSNHRGSETTEPDNQE